MLYNPHIEPIPDLTVSEGIEHLQSQESLLTHLTSQELAVLCYTSADPHSSLLSPHRRLMCRGPDLFWLTFLLSTSGLEHIGCVLL